MEYLCESCWNYPCASDKTKKITGCFAYRTKPTNGDKLRSMSDEELADWLATAIARHYNQEAAIPEFEKGLWLDWLTKEAEDE